MVASAVPTVGGMSTTSSTECRVGEGRLHWHTLRYDTNHVRPESWPLPFKKVVAACTRVVNRDRRHKDLPTLALGDRHNIKRVQWLQSAFKLLQLEFGRGRKRHVTNGQGESETCRRADGISSLPRVIGFHAQTTGPTTHTIWMTNHVQ